MAIKMKVGDTIKATGLHKDINGDPVDLLAAGITITSGVLSPDGLTRHELTVTIDPDQVTNKGKFSILGQSADWSPGKGYRWDTRYTDSSDYSWSDDTQLIDLGEAGA